MCAVDEDMFFANSVLLNPFCTMKTHNLLLTSGLLMLPQLSFAQYPGGYGMMSSWGFGFGGIYMILFWIFIFAGAMFFFRGSCGM